MSMRTDDFDYNLPEELIAQAPAEPRDSCRLLVVDRMAPRRERRWSTAVPLSTVSSAISSTISSQAMCSSSTRRA